MGKIQYSWSELIKCYRSATFEPITVNYDEYGVSAEPNREDLNDVCEMYNSFPESTPYEVKVSK